MASNVFLGTSGFVYPHWRHGVFYPDGLPQAQELEFYAERFRTVELNNPFYRLPERETFVRWKERTPPDFTFAVKASRYITHVNRLADCADPVATLMQRARGLGRKLEPVLFQLPPNMRIDLGRLRAFLALRPRARRWVLEVRHSSWLTKAVYDLLEQRRVALCIAVGGELEAPPIVTAGFAYVRMHAGTGRDGTFTKRQLAGWTEQLRQWLEAGVNAYVYLNNDWRGFAIENAMELRRLLGIER